MQIISKSFLIAKKMIQPPKCFSAADRKSVTVFDPLFAHYFYKNILKVTLRCEKPYAVKQRKIGIYWTLYKVEKTDCVNSSPITRTRIKSANGVTKPFADFLFFRFCGLSVVCPLF